MPKDGKKEASNPSGLTGALDGEETKGAAGGTDAFNARTGMVASAPDLLNVTKTYPAN